MGKMPSPKPFGFHRDQKGGLRVDGIPLGDIADTFGTPLFVYSADAITQAWQDLAAAFLKDNRRIHYAMKANSNLAVLRLLQRLGAGVDIVSLGELKRALAVGFAGEDIIFSGVGKTKEELQAAITAGIGQINAESVSEIDTIITLATKSKKPVPVAIRINPNITAGGHAKIATGSGEAKFGIASDAVPAAYQHLHQCEAIKPMGLAIHIGSQVMEVKHFASAWQHMLKLAESLRTQGMAVPKLDLGGGIGVDYEKGTPSPIAEFAKTVDTIFAKHDYALCCEPGRYLVAHAGCLVTRVIRTKTNSDGKGFIVVDAAMNDFIRPTLYEAYHPILAITQPNIAMGDNVANADIVGPICETGDYLGLNRPQSQLVCAEGEYFAVMATGAYGAVMRSRYNSRPLASEVMVIDGKAYAVSKPDSIEAMLAAGIIPPPLVPAPAV